MKKNQHGFGVLEAIVIVFGIVAVISWYTIHRHAHPSTVTLQISSTAAHYSTGEYVRIAMLARNDTGKPQDFAWQNCVETLNYWVDNVPKNQPSNTACLLGIAPLPAGKILSRTDTYDPSNLGVGSHTLQISVDGVKSNKLRLTITQNTQTVSDCYSYTEDVTPLCKAIKISTGISSNTANDNNSECLNVKQQFLAGTNLQPIPSLSTIDCNQGNVAYFVANVPSTDLRSTLATLNARHDESQTISDGYATEFGFSSL